MSQFFFPSGVELIEQPYDKYLILAGVIKLAAAAQPEGLIERALEPMVSLFDTAVSLARPV